MASEDGASTTSRKRKEPLRDYRDGERDRDRGDRDREKEREKDRDRDRVEKDREPHHRERERDRDRDRVKDYDRVKDHDRDSRSSRHHRYDDLHEPHGRRSSRDYGRSDRDKDLDKDKDRDGYKSSKHAYHRDDNRRKEKDDRKHWDDGHSAKDERERSASVYREDPREKRDVYEDRIQDDRAEKRPRYDREHEALGFEAKHGPKREETPEEGEI